jgi:hypothetical protein
MTRVLILFVAAVSAFGAEDTWAKVRELKSGTELRVYRQGAKQPILATMDEATEDSLRIVVKNEQRAIPKGEIERIDARPFPPGSRVSQETRSGRESRPALVSIPHMSGRTASSTSSTVKVTSKPEFQTVYRRQAGK